MPKDVLYGKTLRKSFARTQEIMDMPNLLEIQKSSYKWFLETGLREVFKDVDSVTDYSGNLELSFIVQNDGQPITLEVLVGSDVQSDYATGSGAYATNQGKWATDSAKSGVEHYTYTIVTTGIEFQ